MNRISPALLLKSACRPLASSSKKPTTILGSRSLSSSFLPQSSPSSSAFKSSRLKVSTTSHKTFSTAATLPKPTLNNGSSSGQKLNSQFWTRLGLVTAGLGLAQYQLGNAENFFEYSFVTTKECQDLADFYGTEDFMEIFCIFPFVQNFMMRQAEFGDDGTIYAWGLLGPGELSVSINFDEKEEDIDGDGEPDTITWFNKQERFHDQAPSWLFGGFTIWDMTQNFGYNRKEDGTCVVYHHGEHFKGLFLIRLIFQLHAKYVIWATERYVNSEAFGSEERGDQAEELRHNVPLHVFNQFIADLTQQIEQVKSDTQGDEKKQRELEVTLQRLNTITKLDPDAIRPRIRTLKTRKSVVAHSHLVVDDVETKDTIRTAMNQIARHSTIQTMASLGGGKSGQHAPSELHQLQRRMTIQTMTDENQEQQA